MGVDNEKGRWKWIKGERREKKEETGREGEKRREEMSTKPLKRVR